MLITQLYRDNPGLNELGYQILQKWYAQSDVQKQDNVAWLADQLRSNQGGKFIAVTLAQRLGVQISSHTFPPPSKP